VSGTPDDLALIVETAIAAGEVALVMRAAGLATTIKADKTPVTDADLAVDALIKTALRGARPDYGWLSEETADDPARLACARLFVVDPIDGTRAYLKGKPWWSVSIAVVENGQPIYGVVHVPDRAETYVATHGGGARLNGARIHASATAAVEDCAMLADAPMFKHPAWPQPWPPMRFEDRNSVAYRLCSVASGEFDATMALSSKSEWDLAAADLIAREAGCLVTDHKGRPFSYNRPIPKMRSLVCAGPALHRLILDRVEPIDLPN
jgi:myo-inositol-1(or 4)-monophosphatase